MYNNKIILILGCQRSGKTTLTNMISKDQNVSIFSVDSLICAFDKNIKHKHINSKNKIVDKSKILTQFVSDYYTCFTKCYPKQKYIIEACQLLPIDIMKDKLLRKSVVVRLGYPNASIEEIYLNIRKADREIYNNAYTSMKSEDELKKLINSWIKYSKELQKECEELSIPFFETNENREETLREVMKYIMKKMN